VKEATARIDAIAAGGAGVARVDGLVVFVPRTAPGDLVELSYVQKDRLGHGRLRRLVEPSPARVTPRCRHFERDRCGGCQLQHLRDDAQQEARRHIIGDAFARIAKRPVEVPPVIASPAAWGYRNKLTLTLRRDGARWRAGLHQWDDVDRVFAMEECPITHPAVVAGWHAVLAAQQFLPPVAQLRGAVRLSGEGLAVVFEGIAHWPQARDFAECLTRVAATLGRGATRGVDAVRWIDLEGRHHDVLDVVPERPPASFEQVNPAMAAQLQADVVALVRGYAPSHVIDGYAGGGEVAATLGAQGIRVTAIELDPEAAQHAARRLVPPSTVVEGRVEDALATHLPADVVILNPPRAGIDARVCAVLEAVAGAPPQAPGPSPRAIVYVSCNPATLARDLSRLPSYSIARVQGYDMFPQTAHVETVCHLVPHAGRTA
jgi:23S rRNA (uracil1939-C5)-methyltransferase